MRKVLLSIIALTALTAAAQGSSVSLPQKGDFGVEIGFNPISDKFESFKLDEGMLQGRYFASDKDAMVIRIGLGYANMGAENDKAHVTEIGGGLGYERHWYPSSRIDLYAGLAGEYKALRSSKHWNRDEPDYDQFGAMLMTGINVYIVKGLYLGAEMGLAFEHRSYRDSDVSANALATKARPALHVGWTF